MCEMGPQWLRFRHGSASGIRTGDSFANKQFEMVVMKALLLIFLLLSAFLLPAQNETRYRIRAGKLFDSESAQFKSGLCVLVENGRILEVKPETELSESERVNFTLIDLSNSCVLPGLIDAHTHLFFREALHPGDEPMGLDMARALTLDDEGYRAVYGAAKARAYLEYGITAVQDVGNSGHFLDIALQRAIKEGLVTGPRISCSGPGLSSEGGQFPGLIYSHRDLINSEYRIVHGPDDGVQAVRENINQGVNVIKIFSNNTPNNTMLSVGEIRAIVQEAHRYGKRVTAHATDNQSVYNAVMGGVDGIDHGYEIADSTLDLMARRGVILVPTDFDSITFVQYAKMAWPGDESMIPQLLETRQYLKDRLQRAIRHHVTIAAGSDDYVDLKMPFGEPSRRALIAYYEEGVPIPQVLQFATLNASRQLGWSDRIGCIKKGYLADLVAFGPDLDTNIQALLSPTFVMKGGNIIVSK
jgi:imidazolonepropionase-like amidohydrolase